MRIFFKEAKSEEVSIARINKNGQALEIVQYVIWYTLWFCSKRTSTELTRSS
jgi:hypothetical protein